MQKLPVGIQDFKKLREGNYLYVDKTELIAKMPTLSNFIFFSRPRRFGKSLLLSTMKEMYLGNKHLFKGLWAEKNWEWKAYPVIYVDLNDIDLRKGTLYDGLYRQMQQQAEIYGVKIVSNTAADAFRELLTALGSGEKKCVVLVDEYDKPITDFLNDEEQRTAHVKELKAFYSVLKAKDAYIQQAVITGVSKYGKVSIFSDLNNLLDISTQRNFNDLCGYTATELEHYFDDRVQDLENLLNMSKEELYYKIKFWYNGYSWDGKNTVYNPFSVLSFFAKQDFDNFWFETGTPTFLVEEIKYRKIIPYELQDTTGSDVLIESADVNDIGIISLLYQTGYLTIKKIELLTHSVRRFHLGFPNEEVKVSFNRHLLGGYLKTPADLASVTYSDKIIESMLTSDWPRFFEIINSMLASVPYDLFEKKERFFHALVHVLLTSTGLMTFSEVHTKDGRMDTVLTTMTHVYIFEFKLDKKATVAMQQIKDRAYPERFAKSGLKTVLIAVSFDGEEQRANDWLVEDSF